MIAVIDYGVGNLSSLKASLDVLSIENTITNDVYAIEKADKIILPGVGAFGDAINNLRSTGLDTVLLKQARNGKIVLGICVGMQLLFKKSFEHGEFEGLGLLSGEIYPIESQPEAQDLKIPHMGWNQLQIDKDDPILRNTSQGDWVYYVHSYYAKGCENSLVAHSSYGVDIPGIVARENVYGFQFHPEKSARAGLKLLQAFADLKK